MNALTDLSQTFAAILCPARMLFASGLSSSTVPARSTLHAIISLLAFGWQVPSAISAAPAAPTSQQGDRSFSIAQQAFPCSNYIRPGGTLSWALLQKGNQVISQGKLQNIQVQSDGNWSAEQLNPAQNNSIQPVSGNFNGYNFTLLHPQSSETWRGSCSATGINGTINNDSNRGFRIF